MQRRQCKPPQQQGVRGHEQALPVRDGGLGCGGFRLSPGTSSLTPPAWAADLVSAITAAFGMPEATTTDSVRAAHRDRAAARNVCQ